MAQIIYIIISILVFIIFSVISTCLLFISVLKLSRSSKQGWLPTIVINGGRNPYKWPKINGFACGYNPTYRAYFTPFVADDGAHLESCDWKTRVKESSCCTSPEGISAPDPKPLQHASTCHSLRVLGCPWYLVNGLQPLYK